MSLVFLAKSMVIMKISALVIEKKTERLRKHSLSKSHLLAMLKWADSKAATIKQHNILIQVRSQHAAEVADNRKYLKIIIENVAFLAKQNISFREDSGIR